MIFLIFFAYFSKKNKNFVSFSQKLNFFRKIQIKKIFVSLRYLNLEPLNIY